MTDNPGNDKRHALVSQRLSLRAWLWDTDTTRPVRPAESGIRVAVCGRKRVNALVDVKAGGGGSSLGGLSTCGSVWVCPVCSPKVAATRSVEVTDTIRAWQAQGGSVLLVTLTLSHGRQHSLEQTWDALGKGWASVRNGKPWKSDVSAYGIAGYLRVVEVTHSRRNGWHPHAHVLLFVAGTPTDADCEALRERLYGRWSRRLHKEGFRTLDFDRTGKAVGVDVRRADAATVDYLAEYLAKFGYHPKTAAAGVALEATRGDLKVGRKGSRTPWELAEHARDGDPNALALWQEWERTSLGRRQYAWSRGFREALDLDGVLSDQEAAEREEAAHQTVAQLPATTWARLVADQRYRARKRIAGPSLTAAMLEAAARWDRPTFREWLTGHGLAYVDAAPAPLVYAPLPVDPMEADPFVVRTARRHRANYERLRHEAESWRSRDSWAV